ncbi:MAG TPA: DUF4328 domain-containing protein [Chthonomonadaceae bacterium]|nr:DUF4328 domain-containing protein [Chthonomonadaceae bacterium]
MPTAASAHAFALWTIGFLLAGAALDLLAMALDGLQLHLLGQVGRAPISHVAALTNDAGQQAITMLMGPCYLATVAVFADWIYRADRRLHALEVKFLKYTPGWAVGYFFIPILNLLCPYYVVSELWRASDPEDRQGIGWRAQKAPRLLRAWWGCWLLFHVWQWVVVLLSTHVRTADQLGKVTVCDIFVRIIWIVTASLAIAVVAGVDGRQERRAGRMGLGDSTRRGLPILALPALGFLSVWALCFAGLLAQGKPAARRADKSLLVSAKTPVTGIEFSPDGGKLRVWLPVPPRERPRPHLQGYVNAYSFQAQVGSQVYSVSYFDIPETAAGQGSEKAILDRVTGNMLHIVGGRDLRVRDVVWKGQRLREWECNTSSGLKQEARLFMRGHRVYLLFALNLSEPAFPADIERFLNSLAISSDASS